MSVPVFKGFQAKIPLGWVLILPFLLQILGAVEKPSDRLMVETGNRVEQQLENYVGKARDSNLRNLAAFRSGILDLNDFKTLERYFYRQLCLYGFAYVNFGGADGSFIGAGYGDKNVLETAEIDRTDPKTIAVRLAPERGNQSGTGDLYKYRAETRGKYLGRERDRTRKYLLFHVIPNLIEFRADVTIHEIPPSPPY